MWGARRVRVTPAIGSTDPPACAEGLESGAPAPGEPPRVLPDGGAVAPSGAPRTVRLAIAARNLIHTKPYPVPDVHYGSLAQPWPAYDCSGAVSVVRAVWTGLLGASPLDSSQLESYRVPGSGRWITAYANATHARILVARIALDTAEYRTARGRDGGGACEPRGRDAVCR